MAPAALTPNGWAETGDFDTRPTRIDRPVPEPLPTFIAPQEPHVQWTARQDSGEANLCETTGDEADSWERDPAEWTDVFEDSLVYPADRIVSHFRDIGFPEGVAGYLEQEVLQREDGAEAAVWYDDLTFELVGGDVRVVIVHISFYTFVDTAGEYYHNFYPQVQCYYVKQPNEPWRQTYTLINPVWKYPVYACFMTNAPRTGLWICELAGMSGMGNSYMFAQWYSLLDGSEDIGYAIDDSYFGVRRSGNISEEPVDDRLDSGDYCSYVVLYGLECERLANGDVLFVVPDVLTAIQYQYALEGRYNEEKNTVRTLSYRESMTRYTYACIGEKYELQSVEDGSASEDWMVMNLHPWGRLNYFPSAGYDVARE